MKQSNFVSILPIVFVLLVWIGLGVFLWFNDHTTIWHWCGYIEASIFAALLCILICTHLHLEWKRQEKIMLAFIKYGLWPGKEPDLT